MTTASWVIHAKAAVGRAWRKARLMAFVRGVRDDMRKARRSAGNSGWWSDMQDRWAEEDHFWGERWSEKHWR